MGGYVECLFVLVFYSVKKTLERKEWVFHLAFIPFSGLSTLKHYLSLTLSLVLRDKFTPNKQWYLCTLFSRHLLHLIVLSMKRPYWKLQRIQVLYVLISCTDQAVLASRHAAVCCCLGSSCVNRILDGLVVISAPFTWVLTNICKDKILLGSTLYLHKTGVTGQIFEWLSVQVWDLKKVGPKLTHLGIQKFVQFRRSHVIAEWNCASCCPCKNLSGPV